MKKLIVILAVLLISTSLFATDIDVVGSVSAGYGTYNPKSSGNYKFSANMFDFEFGAEFYFIKSNQFSLGMESCFGMSIGKWNEKVNGKEDSGEYMAVSLFIGPIASIKFSDAVSMSLAIGYDTLNGDGATLGIEPGISYNINKNFGITALARFGIVANYHHFLVGVSHVF